MKKATITEAKNNLRALIDGLASGSPVLIVDRGRPVARLEPVGSSDGKGDGRLSRLVRAGIVRCRPGAPPWSLFSSTPPRPNAGSSAVAALIEERREAR